MKRILLAGAGVLAMASLANAADLPRQMYTKAPPPMAAPYYNWTGFYIGINGGGAWGTSTWDSTGGFDVSDWLMRNHGQDPYAHRKLALLDATRDERAELGRRHRDAELARSAELVERSLRELWAAPRDLRAHKQALFELWDDCAETGDAAVVAAGEAARRLVLGFIRSHLPAGSTDAFTPAEIAALARTQQSKAVFRPYE